MFDTSHINTRMRHRFESFDDISKMWATCCQNEFVTFDFTFFSNQSDVTKIFVVFQVVESTWPWSNKNWVLAFFPTKTKVFRGHFIRWNRWKLVSNSNFANWCVCFCFRCRRGCVKKGSIGSLKSQVWSKTCSPLLIVLHKNCSYLF